MNHIGTNIEWKSKLELELNKQLQSYNVNWRRVYNIVKINNWNRLLTSAINAEETAIALDNIEGKVFFADALMKAINNDDVDMFRILINDNRAEIHDEAIRTIVRNEFTEAIDILIETNKAKSKQILVYACKYVKISIVKMLIDKYNINIASNKYPTISNIVGYYQDEKDMNETANMNEEYELTKLILSSELTIPLKHMREAFERSCTYNAKVAKLILQDKRMKIPTHKHNTAPLIVSAAATKLGDVELVSMLLKCDRIDPTINHNQAIWAAVREANSDIVRLLLDDNRVAPSDSNNRAIRSAGEYIFSKKYRDTNILLNKGKITSQEYEDKIKQLEINSLNIASMLYNNKQVYDKLTPKQRTKYENMLGG